MNSVLSLILILIGSYLIGSVPTAYLVVRRKAGVDIRKAGSGNVGAFNTFDVTKSKIVGITVGVLDALKGFLVSASLAWLLKSSCEVQEAGLVCAIIGHNYPVWLKFKGGRGLATGAGGLFAVGLSYTIAWCVVWAVTYGARKDILLGNLAAIFAAPLILLIVPAAWIEALGVVAQTAASFRTFAFILSGLLILSHLDAIKNLRTNRKAGNE